MTQFMKPQIEFGEWLLCDGACGIEAVPADLVYIPKWMTPDFDYDTDCMEEDSDLRNVLDSVEDFIESNVDDVTSVQLIEGYGARLSAPRLYGLDGLDGVQDAGGCGRVPARGIRRRGRRDGRRVTDFNSN